MNKKFKKLVPIAYKDSLSNKVIFGFSSKLTRKVCTFKGFRFFEYACDVTSYSHPAYTGDKKFVIFTGRVEKFNRKFKLI
jgi:large subunit ribosomal protein L31